MRGIFVFVALGLVVGCASTGEGQSVGSDAYDPRPGGMAPQGSDLSFSRARFPLRIGYRQAIARFREGASCGGGDSPESIIGRPDRRNQINVAQDRIVTYGFRFREGTLLIRCRADVVEAARPLK